MSSKIETLKPRLKQANISKISTPSTERIRGYTLQVINRRIAVRDEFICQICHKFTIDGEVDHIVPLHMGGAESDSNRQYLCLNCHREKTRKEERERNKH